MKAIRNILVIVDPASTAPIEALEKVAMIAKRCAARVELVAGEDNDARSALNRLSASLSARGIEPTVTVLQGYPLHRVLLTHIKECGADWVIKQTHHRYFPKLIFSRGLDWHLINDCPVPILLTKSFGWGSAPVILAAIDPSIADLRSVRRDPNILEIAFSLTRLLGGTLHVVHAYRAPTSVHAATSAGAVALNLPSLSTDADWDERTRQYDQVSRFVESCHVQAHDLHVDMGRATAYLPLVALQSHASILVIGADTPGNAIPILHDGIAAQILEALPCDLLVLRSPTEACPAG